MPPPRFSLARIFADQALFNPSGDDWSQKPNKAEPTGLGEGFRPAEKPAAEHHNYLFNRHSKWSFLTDIEARNFGEAMAVSSHIAGMDYIDGLDQWVLVGTTTGVITAAYSVDRGQEFTDVTADTAGDMTEVCAGQFYACHFSVGSGANIYVRRPHGEAGDYDEIDPGATMLAWAQTGAPGWEGGSGYLVDPRPTREEDIWAPYTQVGGTARLNIARIRMSEATSITLIDAGEIEDRGSYTITTDAARTWVMRYVKDSDETELLLFAHSTANENLLWRSQARPNFTTSYDRLSLAAAGLQDSTSVGIIVGAEIYSYEDDPTTEDVVVVTSTGRVFLSNQLDAWTEIGVNVAGTTRTFTRLERFGDLLIATGDRTVTPPGPGPDVKSIGYWISSTQGRNWEFFQPPIRADYKYLHKARVCGRRKQHLVFHGRTLAGAGGYAFSIRAKSID